MSRERLERVTIPEAASRLGVTQSAVRQRIRRDSISWEKGEDGRTYVFISPDVTRAHRVDEASRDELVEELRDRVRSLEEQLARRDAIMMRLTESLGQLEAPRDVRESPENASEGAGRGGVPPEQEEPISRPWWRRWFGA
jgi:predicted transcriptional regulator